MLLSAISLLAAACGAAPQEYARLAAERDSLVNVVSQLQAELDEIRNGPSERLARIMSAMERADYAYVISGADSLAERHPATAEAREVRIVARTAQAKLDATEAERKAAAERAAREAAKTAADRVRDIIRIRSMWVSRPNTAGGVDLHIVWQNRSQKTVKYARFSVVAYNAVGDQVSCTIRGYSSFTGRDTGPVAPMASSGGDSLWENAWWNHSITKGVLESIELEYMDGSTVTLTGEDVKHARW